MMPCHLPKAAGKIAVALAAALWATSLHAQTMRAQTEPADPDTLIFGQRQAPDAPTFWIAPLHGTLDLRSTYTKNEITTESIGSVHATQWLFQEQLTLYSHGYIVHPNLVDLRFSVTGGLTQNWVDTNTGSDNTTGTIYGWDINAIILRNQPASITLYTRRTEGNTDVPFGPTLTTTSTVYGARLDYHTADTFMTLDAYHQVDEQSSFGFGEPGFTETRDVLTGNGQTQLSEHQTLDWTLDLEQAHYESGGSSSSERSIGGSLSHNVAFGDDYRNSLSSGVSYSQSRGEFDIEDFRWNEHLHLYHTPNFETNYDYTYEQLTYGDATTDHQSAYVDARHQLYKSLTSIGRVHWDDISSSSGQSIQTYGADLNLNYRKNTPDGILFADAHLGWEEQNLEGSGEVVVPVQTVAFSNLDPVTISQTNVIPGSVLIRDASTGRIYTQGIDYTLSPTPTGMQIDRVLGGNITPGQPLLLSYTYDPEDASQITTDTFGTGVRYQFTRGLLKGFTPYARFFGQNQSVSGGNAQPVDVRDYTTGVYYQYKDLTLKAEREWYDSSVYPYDAWRYEARVNHQFSADTSAAAGLIYTDTQYHDPDQATTAYSLNATVTQRLTTHLSVSVYGAYVDVDVDNGSRSQGIEEGLQADWYQRDTKVYIRLRNSTLSSDTNDRNFQFFQIGLTRSF